MRNSPRVSLSQNEQGQAVVEYVLMLVIALGVVTSISVGFKKSLLSVWQVFAQEVSAPCPGDCTPNPSVRVRN
jgi:Flp pilus assembly pilin Flp